jgi:geranylgeranyl diphosphate synthase type II
LHIFVCENEVLTDAFINKKILFLSNIKTDDDSPEKVTVPLHDYTTMYKIDELQTLISGEINNEILRLQDKRPANLYEPIAYALSMGGKRIRPAMVALAYNLFSENINKSIPAAVAIEVFHNFTLLHDDIMDQAEMRRNRPSVYKKFNENIAILSGDAMSIMAFNYLQNGNYASLEPMISLFAQTALEVCEGQQHDMDFEQRSDVSIQEYMNMIRLKTAVLMACSLKLGALAADAPENMADLLYVFGLNLGIAFQLQDDLLDVFAVQEKFGKKIGGDIISNKKTFLLLKALEIAESETKIMLENWMSKADFDPKEKVDVVTNIYNKLNIKQITESHISEFYQSAINILEEINVSTARKSELFRLAGMIMDRDS